MSTRLLSGDERTTVVQYVGPRRVGGDSARCSWFRRYCFARAVGGVLACGISVGVQAAQGRLRCLGTQVPGGRGDESSSVGLSGCAELRWEIDSIRVMRHPDQ